MNVCVWLVFIFFSSHCCLFLITLQVESSPSGCEKEEGRRRRRRRVKASTWQREVVSESVLYGKIIKVKKETITASWPAMMT